MLFYLKKKKKIEIPQERRTNRGVWGLGLRKRAANHSVFRVFKAVRKFCEGEKIWPPMLLAQDDCVKSFIASLTAQLSGKLCLLD
jgi:hypothetical protein